VTFSKANASLFNVRGGWCGNHIFAAIVDSYASRLLRWNTAFLLLLATGLPVLLPLH